MTANPVTDPRHVRVLVCGGRSYPDSRRVHSELDELADEHPRRRVIVVTGGAQGADAHAETWPSIHRAATIVFRAQWRKFGRSAGPRRNQAMLDYGVDIVLAFPGGRGTSDMIRRAETAGIPVRRIAPLPSSRYRQTPIELTNAQGYTFGRWPRQGRASGEIFGLAYEGHPTHMTYGTDYIETHAMVERTRAVGHFHFDVGREITCTASEFERCMKHVGLFSG